MLSKYTQKNLTWIDVEAPTKEEVEMLVEEYDIDVEVAKELTTNTYRPKVDLHEKYMYIVMHFPTTDARGKVHDQEIDFILGKDFLISVHYNTINPLHEFKKAFEVQMMLHKQALPHAGFIIVDILKELYKNATTQLEAIENKIIEIENHTFSGNESKMVTSISHLNRELLDFKQATRLHSTILKSFVSASKEFFGLGFDYHLSVIVSEYEKVKTTLEANKDLLIDLRETNDSLLTSKTNDVIKILTIMNFIMLPLGLITWVFGMNTTFIFIKDMTDFYIVIGSMCLTAIVMFIYFKNKKWL